MMPFRRFARASVSTESNQFLSGNFAPVSSETTAERLRVRGQIPDHLDGRLLRIGPNPVGPVDSESYHWFTGTGMVHGIRIREGRADWYRSRFTVNTNDAPAMRRVPIPGPGDGYGAVNTHVTQIAGRVYALVEAGALPIELDEGLESVRRSDFDGALRGGFTAHPKLDPLTGEVLALCYKAGRKDVHYVVVDADGRARTRSAIPIPSGPLIHDVGFTKRFVIVLDLPVNFQPTRAQTRFPYVWNEQHVARVGLLPRDGNLDQLKWFDAPTCFVFHFVNAYENDGKVIADVMRHPRALEAGHHVSPDAGKPLLARWTFDPERGTLTEALLDDHGTEFPRFDSRLAGQSYRYCYSSHWGNHMRFGPAFKHDLVTGRTEVHDFGPSRVALEPVFVPRTIDSAEDDGYVMTYVYDANRDRSDVVIWSATEFAAEPLAVIELPVRVPFGFHGDWIG
jgi:carotenoid cleavage dioxygenase-like enzyme